MLTLYSYPKLFGVADNNGYGLKVFAFLKLAGVPFRHEHIFDASKAPRGQLPYIVDGDDTVGDSETIMAYVTKKYARDARCRADAGPAHHRSAGHAHARRPLLGDVLFALEGRALLAPVPRCAQARASALTDEGLMKAKEFNAQRYYYQGIGRYEPDAAMARGLADLAAHREPDPAPRLRPWRQAGRVDAGIYGFIANIYFYDIDTPLKQFVVAHDNLVRHCRAIHAMVSK